jgi:hypothetical protein
MTEKRPVGAAFVKEAKEEGKALREGDARSSGPGSHRDTRIEEVSKLGRGLKSFCFYGLFCCQ